MGSVGPHNTVRTCVVEESQEAQVDKCQKPGSEEVQLDRWRLAARSQCDSTIMVKYIVIKHVSDF